MLDLRTPGLHLALAERRSPTEPPETATTAFVGIAERGPLHRPQRLTGWGDYLDVFGGFVPSGWLAESVYVFFLNGGRRAVVVRVADVTDRGAENVEGLCPRRDLLAPARTMTQIPDRNGDATLAVEAANSGQWGNALSMSFRPGSTPFTDLTALTAETMAGALQIQVAAVADLDPGMVLHLRHPTDASLTQAVTVAAVSVTGTVDLIQPLVAAFPVGSAVLGRATALTVTWGDRVEVFDPVSMNPAHPRALILVVNGPDEGAEEIERRDQGQSLLVRVTQQLGAGDVPRFRPAEAQAILPEPNAVAVAFAGGGDGALMGKAVLPGSAASPATTLVQRSAALSVPPLTVDVRPYATRTALPVPIRPGDGLDIAVLADDAGLVVGDTLAFAHAGGTDTAAIAEVQPGNRVRLVVPLPVAIPADTPVSIADRVTLRIFEAGQAEPVETYPNLSGDPASTRHIATVVNGASPRLCADPAPVPTVPQSADVAVMGAVDEGAIDPLFYLGRNALDAVAVLPENDGPFGLETLADRGEVDLVNLPDLSRARIAGTAFDPVQYAGWLRQVMAHAWRSGRRVALLDPLPEQDSAALIALAANLAGAPAARFGALYAPWLDLSYQGVGGTLPPSGAMAGVIARSDAQGGLDRAPANQQLMGIVATELIFDRAGQAALNAAGVNAIRKMREGLVLPWGARTLSSAPRHLYLTSTRVIIGLRKTIERKLLWAVFEPSGPALWSRVEAALLRILQRLLAGGATAGARPSEAYYVRCNAETNPPAIRDAGQLVAEIGVAITAPAEFVVLRVRRSADAVNVIEEDT